MNTVKNVRELKAVPLINNQNLLLTMIIVGNSFEE